MSTEPEQPADEEVENDAEDPVFAALLRKVAHAPRLPAGLLEAAELSSGRVPLVTARQLPAVGEVIDGRYRIDGELGRGGMGVVFAARNLRTGRNVALKWMLPRGLARSATDRSESALRFEREARAVGRIDHPNVVRVLDVGGDPDFPYLVMERLEGESLRARFRRGPMPWDDALLLLRPALEGVAAAHRAGVVHRDLKPDNIFVCTDGVKVLDFGVSRIRGDEDHTTLTRTGTMLGTPAYMPLEQLRGSREVDERTDVYALGVILYEALAGRLPFEAQTAADQAVLLATGKPHALGELVPALRGARGEAVMRALANKSSERYPSVEAMIQALSQAGRLRAGRHPLWLGLTALAIALALVVSWMNLRAEPVPPANHAAAVLRPAPVAPASAKRVLAPAAIEKAQPLPVSRVEAAPTSLSTPVPAHKKVRSAHLPAPGSLPEMAPPRPASDVARKSVSTSLSVDQFRGPVTLPNAPAISPAASQAGSPVVPPALRPDEF